VSKISAVIVTTGRYDLEPVLENLRVQGIADEIIVWNNHERPFNAKVYGRYLAIHEATHDYIYTQDDDCLPRDLHLLRPNASCVVANMPWDRQGDKITLLGWGSLFHRDLPFQAFRRYFEHEPMDDLFLRTCDVVFACQRMSVRMNLGVEHLPWFNARDRMHRQPDHYTDRDKVRSRIDRLMRGVLTVEQVAES
jgi:hypothetical protein